MPQPTPGSILSQQSLSLAQRALYDRLLAAGITKEIARQLALAVAKSSPRAPQAIAKSALKRASVAKAEYHEAFVAAAKEQLPAAMMSQLHDKARSVAGGKVSGKVRRAIRDGLRLAGVENEQTEVEGKDDKNKMRSVVDKGEGLVPPKGVQAACKRGLELAPEYGGSGLTDGAKARARSMAEGNAVSPKQIARMASFFARHGGTPRDAEEKSPMYVSWLLWGGDAGKVWAQSQREKLDKSGSKPLGAAYSHARASGKKKDKKSVRERANRWLKENGHEVVGKAEWSESDHPRAENGELGEGGGGGGESSAGAAGYKSDGKKATDEQKQNAVRAYGNFSYRDINNAAVDYDKGAKAGAEKHEKDARRHVEALSQAIGDHDPEKSLTLYRGMTLGKDVKVGDTLAPHGFTSASESKSVASGFAKQASKSDTTDRVVATIRTPKGTNVLNVGKSGLQTNSSEKEHIFNHRQKFRVVEDKGYDSKGIRQVVLEPVGHVQKAATLGNPLAEQALALAKMGPLANGLAVDAYPEPAAPPRKKKRVPKQIEARIVKAEQAPWKKLVTSVVYEPNTYDTDGDFMDAETIEKACHNFMREGGYINVEHAGEPVRAEVVENWIAPIDISLGQPGDDMGIVRAGTWLQTVSVEDDAIWQGVLDGTFTGFSLEGTALREPGTIL